MTLPRFTDDYEEYDKALTLYPNKTSSLCAMQRHDQVCGERPTEDVSSSDQDRLVLWNRENDDINVEEL